MIYHIRTKYDDDYHNYHEYDIIMILKLKKINFKCDFINITFLAQFNDTQYAFGI